MLQLACNAERVPHTHIAAPHDKVNHCAKAAAQIRNSLGSGTYREAVGGWLLALNRGSDAPGRRACRPSARASSSPRPLADAPMRQTVMLLVPFISVAIGIVVVLVCHGSGPELHKKNSSTYWRSYGRRDSDRRMR